MCTVSPFIVYCKILVYTAQRRVGSMGILVPISVKISLYYSFTQVGRETSAWLARNECRSDIQSYIANSPGLFERRLVHGFTCTS